MIKGSTVRARVQLSTMTARLLLAENVSIAAAAA